MSNQPIMTSIWYKEQKKIQDFLSASISIPDETLTDVDFATMKSPDNLVQVPKVGGVYFIWTDEPITHSLNGNDGCIPFNGGKIMYNGVSSGLRGRCEEHLLRTKDLKGGFINSQSAISVDLYCEGFKGQSHTKRAYSAKSKLDGRKSKVPTIKGNKVRIVNDLLNLGNLSNEEHDFLMVQDGMSDIAFNNGINVADDKHLNYEWKFYFIELIEPFYKNYIELQWRIKFGTPQLCSYSTGR